MSLINFIHKYQSRNKYIYVPTAECVRKGEVLLSFFRQQSFPPYFFHYQSGGHVAALQSHLQNRYFFKIDLQSFFYSISRNRVAAALHHFQFASARSYSKWSCVINPYAGEPLRHVLPIGFVQSPLLATLALLRSPAVEAIERAHARGCWISVYFDDFIGSGVDRNALQESYDDIMDAFAQANLKPNPQKLVAPSDTIRAFNCDLRNGVTNVTADRISEFYSEPRTPQSIKGFKDYCFRVARANQP